MSQQWYDVCCRYRGQVVRIHDRSGNVHVGRITRVTPNRVYISPNNQRNLGGFGYGYPGWGWGWGWGFGYGIALGAIAGIALVGLFW
ncbi:hypothetical protein PNH38_07995 [Anoxybacillus rupiensis]|jgi:hypothetical protein|uniref:Uncharacterized protein n=2 Tax=Anoxybacteroides rupiense TaxID=311460 RepID=A0ABD5ISY8_9BACL|nr:MULTISPECIES: hypothetical protein [Anoxybacillus]KXG09396.1 hypothetical protein AT864_02350 [Anoxybacillus sp. P3H1B]MBB3908005.1 hypothetical protein [Anoxybacillus rupiensis]MBS2771809.1 hypothetical protein [Anoxybacillus rupiensis]MDE8563823.1 hypothetical protein [Anoxybacillus rupiensis]MED5051420.1 hypothetical protein [Anoxybacillus rupiensis]